MQQIQVSDLRTVLNQDRAGEAIILDVRTPGEYQSERIEGTANIPLSEIDRHLDNLRNYNHIYVHCASGARSSQACEKLNTLGLDNIVNVEGGLSAWKNEGFPVYRSTNAPLPLNQQVQVAAGSLILTGVTLGAIVNPIFMGISAFVGAGLTYAGLSGNCGMAILLARMPWNRATT
jgi:rhodanese-related sulfurtransferase